MVLLAKHIKGAYSKEDKESKVFLKQKNCFQFMNYYI